METRGQVLQTEGTAGVNSGQVSTVLLRPRGALEGEQGVRVQVAVMWGRPSEPQTLLLGVNIKR